jgi:tetratricopeptide (TPR) repeat protein
MAKTSELDDEISILVSAQKEAREALSGDAQARQLASLFATEARIHGEKGRHMMALHSLTEALHTVKPFNDPQTIAFVHSEFGRLESKHYRYASAETHFHDALSAGWDLDNVTLAPFLAGAGWAALMREGGASRAESAFFDVLEKVGPLCSGSLDEGYMPPPAGICHAYNDGLDGDRAAALAGLCLKRAVSGNMVRESDRSYPGHLCDCAKDILRSGETSEPAARRSLGLAWQALGSRQARKEQHSALLEEQAQAARSTSCVLHLGFAGSRVGGYRAPNGSDTTELRQCSHSALHLGFAEYTTGDKMLASNYIDQFVSSVLRVFGRNEPHAKALLDEAVEWISRFAHAINKGAGTPKPNPRGADYAALLTSKAIFLRLQGGDEITHPGQLTELVKQLQQCLARGSQANELFGELLESLVQSRDLADTYAGMEKDLVATGVASLHRLVSILNSKLGATSEAVASLASALEAAGTSQFEASDVCGEEADYGKSELLTAYVDLAFALFNAAEKNARDWRTAVARFRDARRYARSAFDDEANLVVRRLEHGFWNALRLAHRRGAYESSPGPRNELLFGQSCGITLVDPRPETRGALERSEPSPTIPSHSSLARREPR